jgi:hypothetical protein
MSKAVVQGQEGDTATGLYDGYGRLESGFGEVELTDRDGHFALWHKACWELKGRPAFSGTSRPAHDQGCPPADELPVPQTASDVDEMLKKAVAKRAAEQKKRAKVLAELGLTKA